jgi:alkylation response protein AidB-like acyl-CoA dehydrogenase
MDFEIPPRATALLERIRAFVKEDLLPLEPELALGWGPLLPYLDEKRRKVKALGLWAPWLEKEWGGLGLSLVEFACVAEELGRSPLAHYCFNCQAPDVGNMEVLARHGTPAQKERFLAPLARGEIRSCFSMTEPGRAGSNPTWLDTRAVREGESYVLTGRKWFTSSAEGASFAIVMAVTNPEEKPHLRASMIIVPTDTPGFVHARKIPVMGEPGDGWASHSEIVYESCRVPVTNRLGAEGAGFTIAQERLGPGRIHHCMRWIGVCERAFDLLCARAATRELAPGELLASKDTIQAWVAEIRAEIDAARLLVLKAASRIDARGQSEARDEISIIKFFVANVLQRTLDRAIQVHGALGVTDDTPLAWWYRHERGARIYDGPDEVHKASLGKRILKTYGAK